MGSKKPNKTGRVGSKKTRPGKSKRTRLIIIIVIVAIIAVLAVVLSRSSCTRPTLLSQEAPDFTLATMTGVNMTRSELEGTPVVLNFWASWCGPCAGELPYFEAVAQESAVELAVLGVNVGDSAATVQDALHSILGSYEPSMMVALDADGEVFAEYCEKDNPNWYIPVTFLIDSEGIVRHIKIGAFMTEQELWDLIDSVF
jgi:thiol-disulfide isomerase/thioredoxin